jgi:hypothetical protein
MPALATASLIAIEPRLVAGKEAKVLLKLPIGVRTALTITTSLICRSLPKYFGIDVDIRRN